jgi:hypothetical protein
MRWMNLLAALSLLLFCCDACLQGQARPTARRTADLQVGIGYTSANSDYVPNRLNGGAVYATLDVTSHLGGEFVIHQANSGTGDKVYERTYELGARYFRTYGRFKPYVKGMYGRGVFNFPYNSANLAYNIFTGGGGADVAILPFLNVRADYEFQDWRGFPPRGLNPQVLTFGVAYHFPGGLERGRHY